jgi:hypothetical protein
MISNQTNLIVGASLAGAKADGTLRREGFDGRIVLLGAEQERAATDSIPRLIRRGVEVDDRGLSDSDVPLEELAQFEMRGVV